MVGFEIKTVHNLLKRNFEALAKGHEQEKLTGMQRWIIDYLSDHEGKDIFQRDIEDEFSVRRSTATGILQLMEKNDLITRETVCHDARLKKLVLTPKAIEIQKNITEEIKEHEKMLCEGISQEDLDVFFTVMKQIKKNLEK